MRRLLAGFLLSAVLATGPAHAETCAPLRLLDQIPLVPVNGGSSMLVPVKIDGVDKFMVFDTGGAASSVTRALATELGLAVHPNLRAGALFDAYGDASRDMTTVRDFKLGHQDVSDAEFRIWPNPYLETADPRLAGVLSRDQLLQYDVDADFPAHILKLFSPDHCEGNILYWKADAVAISNFDTRGNHFNIMATLDGKELHAIIDSGAGVSILTADSARRFFGITADSPGMSESATLTKSAQYPVYQHQFSELDFGGVAVKRPVIAIWPDMLNRTVDRSLQNTGNRAVPMSFGVRPAQMIIGMDILSKLHMYIASREHRIYFSSGVTGKDGPAAPP